MCLKSLSTSKNDLSGTKIPLQKKNKYGQQLLLKAVATSHHKLYNHALKKEREIRTDYSTALVF